jgi:L-threonylcarbamoyladenylate synthase
MKTIIINKNKIKESEINIVHDFLSKGKIIAYPTDTIYGLGCLATDVKAVKKIFKIKRIPKQRSLLMLVKCYQMLKKYCYVNKKQEEYLKKIWPGSVTVILNGKGNLPKEVSSKDGSFGVRLPKNDFLIKLIRKVGVPIISTSLNISGRENVDPSIDLKKYFGKNCPDLVIDSDMQKNKRASKIIDLKDIKNIKILRNK